MIIVVPPHAAARVPVSNVSADMVPPKGISMWVWASMPPGTTYFPVASTTRSAASCQVSESPEKPAASAATFSSWTRTSNGKAPSAVMRVDQAEVEVAYDNRLVDVGGHLADELAARIDEVRLAVELVRAERLHADPVDRTHEVLVRHRSCRLLQPPEVLGHPPAGRGGIEDDLRARESEGPPTLGEVTLVADVDADPTDRRVEYGIPKVAWPEVELLPEAGDLRNVILPVLSEITPVRVDDRGRVVENAGMLDFVNGDDDHGAVLPRHVHELPDRRPFWHWFSPVVPRAVLDLAEVRPVEQFL